MFNHPFEVNGTRVFLGNVQKAYSRLAGTRNKIEREKKEGLDPDQVRITDGSASRGKEDAHDVRIRPEPEAAKPVHE